MRKTIYIGFSFLHHGEHAGYDQIKKYLNYDKVIDCQRDFNFLASIHNKKKFFSKLYRRFVGSRLWWVELKLIFISVFNQKKLAFHIIYGENIFKYLGHFKFGNQIILTLHQPPLFYTQSNQKSFLKNLQNVDKLITMSKDMELYFKSKFPDKEILYIPHGVDTDYFSPAGAKENRILMIGNWLRNFEFASKVFNSLTALNSNISITVITNKENHNYFKDDSIELLSSITDEQLLLEYCKAKVVFLPLTKFTANNASLEALSCGCQVIISTSKENFTDIKESPILFVENDVDKVCDNIINACKSWKIEDGMELRNKVKEKYGWDIIARETRQFITKEITTLK